MRYFIKLAYKGTNYNGWQIQPSAPSVQQTIETAMSTILAAPIELVGCGRTDTGVHAKEYYAHFDYDKDFPKSFLPRINKFLPNDIVFYDIFPVEAELHARFDAYHRAYEYHIVFDKNPFEIETAWYYYDARNLDMEQMQAAAKVLLAYNEFAPFCKTNHQAKTLICELKRAEWETRQDRLVFHIAANRFLRGMVRLIVGMFINIGSGKVTIDDLKTAMDGQIMMKKSHSVPAHGLYLTDIRYSNRPPLSI
jgi:tRNA pseudouridine38-40 synthase